MNRWLAVALLSVVAMSALGPMVARADSPPTSYVQPAPQDDDFPEGYRKPSPTYPEPPLPGMNLKDIAVLAATLLAAAWLILRFRSRFALTLLVSFTVVYFGCYRTGCVCPIGSIQNVVLSVVDRNYTISIVVTGLFLLPIIAAFLFGRVFCGGACPLGAVQDLLLRKPVRIPLLLDKILRWGRWVYLATAVYFVLGGLRLLGHDLTVQRDFVICKYDPFVDLFRTVNFASLLAHDWGHVFRLVGPWWMWIVTGVLLGGSVFIGRPYCRWICPYGAILGTCSRLSWKKVAVMPDECIDCRVCDDACPFGAIEEHAAVRATCLACNRCYASCPMERKGRWLPVPAGAVPATTGLAATAVPIERSPLPGRRMQPVDEPIDLAYLDAIIAEHGRDADAALPILQAVQARHRYLPYPALVQVAQRTDVPMAKLIGLATFYNQFRTAPIGEHLVKVCCGTACHVAGAKRVSDSIRLYLGLTGEADTDAARRFTVQEVACVGCCSLAPVMQVDETTFGHLTAETAAKTLETFLPHSHKRHVAPPVSQPAIAGAKQHKGAGA